MHLKKVLFHAFFIVINDSRYMKSKKLKLLQSKNWIRGEIILIIINLLQRRRKNKVNYIYVFLLHKNK